jgi:hypothetical protein
MRSQHHLVTRLTLAALLAMPVAFGACGGHLVFDPYYNDYHRWNGSEDGLYRRWEGDTGRSHLDFGRRPPAEQHAYFGWRHGH